MKKALFVTLMTGLVAVSTVFATNKSTEPSVAKASCACAECTTCCGSSCGDCSGGCCSGN